MNAENTAQEIRVRRFDAAFPKCGHRETWLTMYLALRDCGDNHSAAVATVRGEMLVAANAARRGAR